MELITVIVPVYNVENYLNRCVASIVAQTYSNLEIILVDDGSRDCSGKLCDEWKDKDNRIKVIHKENGGLSSARNAGIDCANGDYFVFIDSDDAISKDMILILYSALCKYGAGISYCNYCTESDMLQDASNCYTEHKVDKMQAIMDLYGENHIYTVVAWNKLYKKELFSELRFTNGKIHEDELIMYKLFDLTDKLIYVDCDLYFYYQRENSITKSRISTKNLDYLLALEERIDYFYNKQYSELYMKNLETYLDMNIYYSTFILDLTREQRKELYIKFKKLYRGCACKENVLWYKRLCWFCYAMFSSMVIFGLRLIKKLFYTNKEFIYK